MPTVLVNNAFEDTDYDVATANSTYGDEPQLYHYSHVNTSLLRGRPLVEMPMYELPSETDPVPEPPPRPTETVRIVKVQQADLWPLWLALAVTFVISITALAQATVTQTAEMQAPGVAGEVTAPLTSQITPSLTTTKTSTTTLMTTSTTTNTSTQTTTVTSTRSPTGCYCTHGTVTFAVENPGPCYALADGQNGLINLLQNNGLYIRAGMPERAGAVLRQSTAANGLTVTTIASPSVELPTVYGPDGTGQSTGWYFDQSILRGYTSFRGNQCSKEIVTSTQISGDAETRPPSMYLTPYVCL